MYARVNLGDDLVFTIQKVRIKMRCDLPYAPIKSLYFVLYSERNALLMRMQKLYDQVQSAYRTIILIRPYGIFTSSRVPYGVLYRTPTS